MPQLDLNDPRALRARRLTLERENERLRGKVTELTQAAFPDDLSVIIDPLDRTKYAHALAHLRTTTDWDEAFRDATADFKEYHYLTLRPNQPQNVHLA